MYGSPYKFDSVQDGKKYEFTFHLHENVVVLYEYMEYRLQLPRTWIPTVIFRRTPSNGYQYVKKHVLRTLQREDVSVPLWLQERVIQHFRNQIVFEGK